MDTRSTYCPRDVCNINVTSVLAPGHVQLFANNAYLNSSSHTTCSANLTCNLCSGLGWNTMDARSWLLLLLLFAVIRLQCKAVAEAHTWIFERIVAHLEQNLWPPTIAIWYVRRQPFYPHNFERPKWSRLRLRSCVPDPSRHLSNTSPNQKLCSMTKNESDVFNLFNLCMAIREKYIWCEQKQK